MTVTSIGYGDVTPMTSAEFWIVSFIMLIGGIMWAYIIGKGLLLKLLFVKLEQVALLRLQQP